MPGRLPSDLALSDVPDAGAYRFLAFELDVRAGELWSAGQKLVLSRQQLALLSTLVRARGATVSRQALLRTVWDGVVVSEGALRQAVWELRKLLGADGERAIEAVRGRGYRLTVQVEPVGAAAPDQLVRRLAHEGLLGRDRELAELERIRYDALHREGRACVLEGPAGVGKSRLARELVERATLDGIACSESYADREGALPPLWPWTQLLDACLQDADDALRARCQALAPSVFAWRQVDGVSAWPMQEPSERRLRLFEQLSRMLTVLLRDKPRVCLLEDLQWADETSLSFLAHHARALTQSRALWIFTWRSTDQGESTAFARAMNALDQGPNNQRIMLSNLGREEVKKLLALQLGDAASEPFIEPVCSMTRGNPMFVLELSRALVEGALPHEPLSPGLDAIALQPVIERRLRRLPGTVLRALQAAAVLGRDCTVAELAAVLEQAASDVLSQVDECLQSGILVELGAHRFGFAHPLLQQVAYALLVYSERSRLHGVVARFLESFEDVQKPRRLSELAHHYYQAGEVGHLRRALDYARRAGEAALAATAFGSAVVHFQRAVRCADLLTDCTLDERIALELSHLEAVHAEQGLNEGTRAAYLVLAERARGAGLWELHARAALGYTGHQHTRFVPARFAAAVDPGEVALLDQALAGLGPRASELRVLTLCSLSYALSGTGDVVRRRQLLHDAFEEAQGLGEPTLLARVLSFQIFGAAGPNLTAESLAACDALVEITLQNGLQELELDARIARYLWLFCRVDRAGALRDAERAAQLAELIGTARATSRAQLPALIEAFGTGRLHEAERLAEQARLAAPDDPNQQIIFMLRSASFATLRGRADLSQAVAGYEYLLAANPHAVNIRAVLSSTYATLGRHEDARRELDAVAADDFAALPDDINWLPTMVMLADAVIWLGDVKRARLVYDRLLPYADAFFFFGVETTPGGAVAMWLGDLAVVLGELERAHVLLDRAHAVHEALGLTLLHQYCAFARARLVLATRAHVERGGPSAALRLMAEVRRFADEHGIAWLRDRADDFERRIASSPPGTFGPTARLSAQRSRRRDN